MNIRHLIHALYLPFVIATSAMASPGETVFLNTCAACHNAGGTGIPGIAPPLAAKLDKQLASSSAKDYFSRLLVGGMTGMIKVDGQTYNGVMPPQGHLTDEDLALVATYVTSELNVAPKGFELTPADFATARGKSPVPAETHGLRKAIFKN